ncbi:hypothetical protein L195_g059301 [Trifolium pratense]|uniref:Uncharacterized protein n=1 Tax=Trifolium pratense TaxID=57577 RepID=A0A2K3JX62_TRIPR|nr:hypothetical protein L195_g059301 [Trifolium pratense]
MYVSVSNKIIFGGGSPFLCIWSTFSASVLTVWSGLQAGDLAAYDFIPPGADCELGT